MTNDSATRRTSTRSFFTVADLSNKVPTIGLHGKLPDVPELLIGTSGRAQKRQLRHVLPQE
jgi:hypothetical protein